MRWPRGKYNGDRISGFRFVLQFNVLTWTWFLPKKWNRAIGIGPVILRLEPEFELRRRG